MKGQKLLIEKTIIPLDWNPSDPNGYNEWMKSIVQQNLITEGLALPENEAIEFTTPKPQFIGTILKIALSADLRGMESTVSEAKKILKGGSI